MFGGCCCSCDLCTDTFAGLSNGTDVSTGTSCGYTEISGDWSISSNALSVTATYASLKINTSVPDNTWLSMSVSPTTTTSYRILFDFVDNDNYLAAEWQRTATSTHRHRIIRRVAGVETILAEGCTEYSIGFGTHTFKACYNSTDGRFVTQTISTWNGATFHHALVAYTTITDTVCGIGTGDTGSAAAIFDTINVDRSRAPTESTGCTQCEHCADDSTCFGGHIAEIEVEVPNLTDSNCTDCEAYGGTYVLTHYSFHRSFAFGEVPYCRWIYELSSPGCTYQYAMLWKTTNTWRFAFVENPNIYLSPTTGVSPNAGYFIFWSGSDSTDCSSGEVTLTYQNSSGPSSPFPCTAVGTTVTIRAA